MLNVCMWVRVCAVYGIPPVQDLNYPTQPYFPSVPLRQGCNYSLYLPHLVRGHPSPARPSWSVGRCQCMEQQ